MDKFDLSLWQGLWAFLEQEQARWQSSLLQQFPESLTAFPQTWIEELADLAEDQLFEFDSCGHLTGLKILRRVFEPIREFELIIPQFHSSRSLEKKMTAGLKKKKVHEIERLLDLVTKQCQGYDVPVIDWGGGMGHLAASIARQENIPVFSIDRDATLQAKGVTRYGNAVHYIQSELYRSQNLSDPLKNLFHRPHASLALHACGPLSLAQIELARHHPCQWLINLGCCFHKLAPNETMISKSASKYGFQLSSSALDLASRTRSKATIQHFRLKRRVNAFRWTIHLYLREELGIEGFEQVGRFPDRVYLGDFEIYAMQAIERLHLPASHVPLLQRFYQTTQIQNRLQAIFLNHLIRWQYARPLELAIIGDRAQWLAEADYHVQVVDLFDSYISPRSLAIIASR